MARAVLVFATLTTLHVISAQNIDYTAVVFETPKLKTYIMEATKNITRDVLKKYLFANDDAFVRFGGKLEQIAEKLLEKEIETIEEKLVEDGHLDNLLHVNKYSERQVEGSCGQESKDAKPVSELPVLVMEIQAQTEQTSTEHEELTSATRLLEFNVTQTTDEQVETQTSTHEPQTKSTSQTEVTEESSSIGTTMYLQTSTNLNNTTSQSTSTESVTTDLTTETESPLTTLLEVSSQKVEDLQQLAKSGTEHFPNLIVKLTPEESYPKLINRRLSPKPQDSGHKTEFELLQGTLEQLGVELLKTIQVLNPHIQV